MKLKKMLKTLREVTEKQSELYTLAEMDYMKHQLEVIEGEIKRIEHRDYKGFGKNESKSLTSLYIYENREKTGVAPENAKDKRRDTHNDKL